RELADVVQDRDELELEQDVRREPQLGPDAPAVPGQPVGVIGRAAVVRAQRGDQLDGRALDRRAGVRTGVLEPRRAVEQSRQRWRSRVGHAPKWVRIRGNAPTTLPLLLTGCRQRPEQE